MSKWIVANWKMNGDQALLERFAAVLTGYQGPHRLVLCPPFPLLGRVPKGVILGAQNCHMTTSGAFTGEVAAPLLVELGCQFVILGHSERRTEFGETAAQICQKAATARAAGLAPILCVGEDLAARQAGGAEQFVADQVKALAPKPGDLIAYEPIWAIGTGMVPSRAELQAMQTLLRSLTLVPILYGGSVKASNAHEVISVAGFDGALVGGASLDPVEFLAIAKACN